MAIRNTNKITTEVPKGLTKETAKVFHDITTLDCIEALYLCGGTAQSIQMQHRLSEDLDFEIIGTKKDRPQLEFDNIINELKEKFPDTKTEILGDDMFLCFINEQKVKLSFFRPENPVKYINVGYTNNNLRAPALQDLLGMKIFTTGVRTKTRDYYDIFCLLEQGCSLTEAIDYASYLSRHMYKSKKMLTNLLTTQNYSINEDFLKMQPKYKITPEEMKQRFLKAIIDEKITKGQAIIPKF